MRGASRRACRRGRRTRWAARAIAADLGLGGNRSPLWRRDNPFWDKAVRVDTRRLLLAGRLLLNTLLLAALLTGGMALHTAYPRPIDSFLRHFGSPLPWAGWLFVAVSFIHLLVILGTRTAFATFLSLEAERQTLPGLLLTPLRRAEMLWAMAVPAAAAALLIALSGLPIYLLLREFGGCEWRDVAVLYVLFGLLAFDPPSYVRPALGPEPPPIARTDRASRSRRSSSALSSIPLFTVLTWTLGRWVQGAGGWGFHLLSTLPPPVPDLLLQFFAWPYCTALILTARLPFFGGHLPPLVYIAPLLIAHWVTSALRTGAALSSGDPQEMRRLPLSRRAEMLSRWVGRLTLFCLLAVVWQPWVLGGDTGRVLGSVAPSLSENLAGLLLLIGSAAIVLAVSAVESVVSARKDIGAPRRLPLVLRRAIPRAVRPLRMGLLLFAAVCLCGGASPFAVPVYTELGRLALVAMSAVLASLAFAALVARLMAATPGYAYWTIVRAPLRSALALGIPFLALTLPPPFPRLAALSPVTAWVELFPGASATIHTFPFWPLGPLPPFALAVAAPSVLGLALLALAYRPNHSVASAPVRRQTRLAISPRTVRYAERTAALMAWITARTDNPLFTYEMRTRTRDGNWFAFFRAAPFLLLLGLVGAALYPAVVASFSFFSLLGFFRGGGPFNSAAPSLPQTCADLAALLLSGELYLLGLRGQTVGEALFLRDQERGTLGFLLLTPLTARQVLWGKVWGQSSGYLAGWALCGVGGLFFYLLAVPATGLAPALAAWAVSQVFVLCAFVLGLGLGAAVATHVLHRRVLRGLSTLLLVLACGGGMKLLGLFLPDNGPFGLAIFLPPPSWSTLANLMLSASAYALALAVLAFAYAHWRVAALRCADAE